jgi:hypothetical protein
LHELLNTPHVPGRRLVRGEVRWPERQPMKAICFGGPAEPKPSSTMSSAFTWNAKAHGLGLKPGAALRQTPLEIGGLDQVEEECRDARGV